MSGDQRRRSRAARAIACRGPPAGRLLRLVAPPPRAQRRAGSSSAETTIVSTAGGAGSAGGGGATPSSGWSVSSSSGERRELARLLVAARCGGGSRRPRRRANRTAVMLSSPPPRFAAWISAFAAAVEVVAVPPQDLLDRRRASTIVERPSEQSRKTSPGCGVDGERVDVDVGVGAERARDHRALRVHLRLLRRQLAAPHELGDERVVVGQLLELVVAQHVGARVADVAEGDACRPARRARPSSSCPCPTVAGVVRRALVDAAVRLLDQLDDAVARRRRSRPLSLERAGGERRGDLARLRAAHAVGDREERRRDRRTRPRCGAACGPGRSPACDAAILTARTSGRSRRCGRRRRASACARASAGCRSRTCRSSSRCPRPRRRRGAARSARGAPRRTRRPASGTSLFAPRPTVSGCESSAILVAVVERRAREHDEPAELARGRLGDQARGRRLLRREDHRLLRQAQVARGRADDPPDEEVEQDEERELEGEQRRLDLSRGEQPLLQLPGERRSRSSRS